MGLIMRKLIIAAIIALFTLSSTAHAVVVGVPFSISGDGSLPGTADLIGTVTGTIFVEDTVFTPQVASSVVLNLTPMSNAAGGPFTNPPHGRLNNVDATDWTVSTNTVTYAGGGIISFISFVAFWDDTGSTGRDDHLVLNGPGGLNRVSLNNFQHFVGNNDGLAGLGASVVPLPAALPLFLSGLVVLGFVARRRRSLQIT